MAYTTGYSPKTEFYNLQDIVVMMSKGMLSQRHKDKGYGQKSDKVCSFCESDLRRFPVYFGDLCLSCQERVDEVERLRSQAKSVCDALLVEQIPLDVADLVGITIPELELARKGKATKKIAWKFDNNDIRGRAKACRVKKGR